MLEGPNDQFVHLALQGFIEDPWIRPHPQGKHGSERGAFLCKLNRNGREDALEVASVLEVSRAEERGSEPSICGHPLRDRLRDRALPRPGQSVQPVDGRLVEILRPEFDFVQDGFARCFQTTFAAARMSIFGPFRNAYAVDGGKIGCWRLLSETRREKPENLRTFVLSKEVTTLVLT